MSKPDLPEKPPFQRPAKRHLIHKKELESRYYSDRVIAPLAAWVHGHRGAMAEVIRRLGHFMGKPVQRKAVQRWLSLDPDERVEPSLGYGLVLMRIIKTMRSEYQAGIAPQYTTGAIQVDPTSVKADDEDLPPSEGEEDQPSEQPDEEKRTDKSVQFFVRRRKRRSR